MEPIITVNEYPIGWEVQTEILHQLEISNLLEQLKNN